MVECAWFGVGKQADGQACISTANVWLGESTSVPSLTSQTNQPSLQAGAKLEQDTLSGRKCLLCVAEKQPTSAPNIGPCYPSV